MAFDKGVQLKLCTRLFRCAVGLILFWGSNAVSAAIDSSGNSSTAIIRSQLQSIADEVVDSAKFDVKERVGVFIEGEGQRALAENAFIEALQKRSEVSIVIDSVPKNQMLHIFLYNPVASVRELNPKLSERKIRTTIEARSIKGAEREVRMLGTFHRETQDTVQAFRAELLPEVQKNDEGGTLQRLLTPFIVVGGAIVIVYLFFMVRS